MSADKEQHKAHSFKQLECLLIQRGFVRLEELSCALKFSLWYRGERAAAWLKQYFASKENQAQCRQTTPNHDMARDFAPIILAQSDTTAGFLSQDKRALNRTKGRQEQQEILRTFASFAALAQFARIPNAHKHFVRRASQTSFVLSPQKAFRVVQIPYHADFLRYFGWLYSTSANAHKQKFSLEFALHHADIVALDSRGIYEDKPSRIFKLSRRARVALRA